MIIINSDDEEYLMEQPETLRSLLVPVPDDADDVCPICRSWRPTDAAQCSNCGQAQEELSRTCNCVIPISLYRRPSQLRDWLKYYKPGASEYHPEYAHYLSVILKRFWFEQRYQIVNLIGDYSMICTVPSSERAEPHPLRALLEECDFLTFPAYDVLSRGPGPLGRRIMSDDAFVTSRSVSGERILLIDDVYTTGSRAQSASSALQIAGATVIAIMVLARRINPEFNSIASAVWHRQKNLHYDFSTSLAWLERRRPG